MAENRLHGPAPDAQTAERDAAVTAASTLAVRLTEFDSADPAASYDKRLQASVEPLTTKLRTDRDQLGDMTPDTITVAPDPIVAPVYVRPGDASFLVLLDTRFDERSVMEPVRMQVVRTEDGSWRAADFTEVDTVGLHD
jgi:hypothetical protein